MGFVAVEGFDDSLVATQFIVVCQHRVLLSSDNNVIFEHDLYADFAIDKALIADTCPLGFWNGEPCEAIYLKHEVSPAVKDDYEWTGLRPILGLIPDEIFYIAGRATQLGCWLFEHKFCGRCGNTTRKGKSDRALVCINCEQRFYPKIAPCVMVLVTRGDECLLASGVHHKEGLYTALAGFVEAGETVEQAGAREVKEEVGLDVDNFQYFGSQPWPFPGQLMIAYTANYTGGDIRIDDKEIIDANWYRYDSLPTVPPTSTIARQLIQHFVKDRVSANSEVRQVNEINHIGC